MATYSDTVAENIGGWGGSTWGDVTWDGTGAQDSEGAQRARNVAVIAALTSDESFTGNAVHAAGRVENNSAAEYPGAIEIAQAALSEAASVTDAYSKSLSLLSNASELTTNAESLAGSASQASLLSETNSANDLISVSAHLGAAVYESVFVFDAGVGSKYTASSIVDSTEVSEVFTGSNSAFGTELEVLNADSFAGALYSTSAEKSDANLSSDDMSGALFTLSSVSEFVSASDDLAGSAGANAAVADIVLLDDEPLAAYLAEASISDSISVSEQNASFASVASEAFEETPNTDLTYGVAIGSVTNLEVAITADLSSASAFNLASTAENNALFDLVGASFEAFSNVIHVVSSDDNAAGYASAHSIAVEALYTSPSDVASGAASTISNILEYAVIADDSIGAASAAAAASDIAFLYDTFSAAYLAEAFAFDSIPISEQGSGFSHVTSAALDEASSVDLSLSLTISSAYRYETTVSADLPVAYSLALASTLEAGSQFDLSAAFYKAFANVIHDAPTGENVSAFASSLSSTLELISLYEGQSGAGFVVSDLFDSSVASDDLIGSALSNANALEYSSGAEALSANSEENGIAAEVTALSDNPGAFYVALAAELDAVSLTELQGGTLSALGGGIEIAIGSDGQFGTTGSRADVLDAVLGIDEFAATFLAVAGLFESGAGADNTLGAQSADGAVFDVAFALHNNSGSISGFALGSDGVSSFDAPSGSLLTLALATETLAPSDLLYGFGIGYGAVADIANLEDVAGSSSLSIAYAQAFISPSDSAGRTYSTLSEVFVSITASTENDGKQISIAYAVDSADLATSHVALSELEGNTAETFSSDDATSGVLDAVSSVVNESMAEDLLIAGALATASCVDVVALDNVQISSAGANSRSAEIVISADSLFSLSVGQAQAVEPVFGNDVVLAVFDAVARAQESIDANEAQIGAGSFLVSTIDESVPFESAAAFFAGQAFNLESLSVADSQSGLSGLNTLAAEYSEADEFSLARYFAEANLNELSYSDDLIIGLSELFAFDEELSALSESNGGFALEVASSLEEGAAVEMSSLLLVAKASIIATAFNGDLNSSISVSGAGSLESSLIYDLPSGKLAIPASVVAVARSIDSQRGFINGVSSAYEALGVTDKVAWFIVPSTGALIKVSPRLASIPAALRIVALKENERKMQIAAQKRREAIVIPNRKFRA